MAVIGAEALTVSGEPGADYLIFGGGEEEIAVFIVSVSESYISGGFCGEVKRKLT